jgi:uncharacterized protein (TIGR00369 family)
MIPLAQFDKFLGIKDIRIKDDSFYLTLSFKGELTNPHRIIHGGVIASMADTAMAGLVSERYGLCYTKVFEIEFFKQAKTDLKAEAKLVNKKMNLCLAEAIIRDKGNEIIAKAKGKYLII